MYERAIEDMIKIGASDTIIALVISSIRSETLSEEFRRLITVIEQNPPEHVPWTRHLDWIREIRSLIDDSTLCAVTGCENKATHTWSGHPTCDDCKLPYKRDKI